MKSIKKMLLDKKENALLTLNLFVDKAYSLEEVKEYKYFLDDIPERTDFINFASEGFELNDNVPIFKGWEVCEETSSDIVKVAKKGECRIYFDTKDGVIIVNEENMSDNITYNDLAIFFYGKLELS